MKLFAFVLLVSIGLILRVEEAKSMQSILVIVPASILSRKLPQSKEEVLTKLKKYIARHNRVHIIGKRMEDSFVNLET
jgi:hypothetical protein